MAGFHVKPASNSLDLSSSTFFFTLNFPPQQSIPAAMKLLRTLNLPEAVMVLVLFISLLPLVAPLSIPTDLHNVTALSIRADTSAPAPAQPQQVTPLNQAEFSALVEKGKNNLAVMRGKASVVQSSHDMELYDRFSDLNDNMMIAGDWKSYLLPDLHVELGRLKTGFVGLMKYLVYSRVKVETVFHPFDFTTGRWAGTKNPNAQLRWGIQYGPGNDLNGISILWIGVDCWNTDNTPIYKCATLLSGTWQTNLRQHFKLPKWAVTGTPEDPKLPDRSLSPPKIFVFSMRPNDQMARLVENLMQMRTDDRGIGRPPGPLDPPSNSDLNSWPGLVYQFVGRSDPEREPKLPDSQQRFALLASDYGQIVVDFLTQELAIYGEVEIGTIFITKYPDPSMPLATSETPYAFWFITVERGAPSSKLSGQWTKEQKAAWKASHPSGQGAVTAEGSGSSQHQQGSGHGDVQMGGTGTGTGGGEGSASQHHQSGGDVQMGGT